MRPPCPQPRGSIPAPPPSTNFSGKDRVGRWYLTILGVRNCFQGLVPLVKVSEVHQVRQCRCSPGAPLMARSPTAGTAKASAVPTGAEPRSHLTLSLSQSSYYWSSILISTFTPTSSEALGQLCSSCSRMCPCVAHTCGMTLIRRKGTRRRGGEGGQALGLSHLCTCETERTREWNWFSGFLSHLVMVLLPDL